MKLSKVVSIMAIAFVLIITLSNLTYATISLDPASISITQTSGASQITELGGKIIGTIQLVGSVLAVGVLVVLGIKYMMGSAEEKAEYKKTLIPYLIGAVLIFAASNIASMVYKAISTM